MTRQLPTKHADTHRPPLTLGPDDPGGSDPLIAGIREITSVDLSLIVTDPTGPVVDLAGNFRYGWAYNTSLLVPAGVTNQVTVDWTVHDSTTMWDYTTPTLPKWLNDGIVAIRCQVAQASGDAAMGAGTQLSYNLQTPAPTSSFPNLITLGQKGSLAADGTQQPLDSVGIGFVFGGDGVKLVIANSDVIDHNVFWWVQAIQAVGEVH